MLVKRDKCQDFKVNSTLQFPALKSRCTLALVPWFRTVSTSIASFQYFHILCVWGAYTRVKIICPRNGRETTGGEAGGGAGRKGRGR